MRRWLYIIGLFVAVGLAYWAYSTAAKTRAASIELENIKSEIFKEQEQIAILKSEWAYLNRPERLRHLVEANASKLGLVMITAKNYGEATLVPYPPAEIAEKQPSISDNQINQILSEVEQSGEEAAQ